MEHGLTQETIDRMVAALEEGFNERDVRRIESVIGDHVVDHSTALGGIDLRQRIARVQAAMPDSTYHVRDYLVQGEAIAWRWSIKGTHSRDIMGYDPTGRRIELNGMSMAVMRHGKVVEHWEFPDYGEFVPQLEDGSSSRRRD